MNNKFLDKVIDQIISETMIKDNKLHTTFFLHPSVVPHYSYSVLSPPSPSFLFSFLSHCKEIYGLKNEQEIEYVWEKYKKEVTTLIDKKELV